MHFQVAVHLKRYEEAVEWSVTLFVAVWRHSFYGSKPALGAGEEKVLKGERQIMEEVEVEVEGKKEVMSVMDRVLVVIGDKEKNLFAFALFLVVLLGVWCVARERVTVVEFMFVPSLLMILLWGWQPFRFLIPYTAFLFYYLAEGLRRLLRYQYRAMQQAKAVRPFALETKWLTFTLGLFLALFLLDIVAFLFIPTTPEGSRKAYYVKRFSEIEGALQWVRDSLPNDGGITTPNPALVHLYSGRKTVSFNEPEKRWEVWKKLNVRYLALVYGLNPLPALTRNEKNFQVVYQHPGQLNLRVVDFGVASNRTDWQASQKSEPIDLRLK